MWEKQGYKSKKKEQTDKKNTPYFESIFTMFSPIAHTRCEDERRKHRVLQKKNVVHVCAVRCARALCEPLTWPRGCWCWSTCACPCPGTPPRRPSRTEPILSGWTARRSCAWRGARPSYRSRYWQNISTQSKTCNTYKGERAHIKIAERTAASQFRNHAIPEHTSSYIHKHRNQPPQIQNYHRCIQLSNSSTITVRTRIPGTSHSQVQNHNIHKIPPKTKTTIPTAQTHWCIITQQYEVRS